MLKKILGGLLVLAVVLALVIATRPAEFRITRSRTVAAPPPVVFGHINDFHKWSEWSPWEKIDPAMKREFGGPPAGAGATYAWAGDKNVGEGRMTITDSKSPQHVAIRLEFLKPFAATNLAQFDLAPSGSGTAVTWTMTGQNDFMAKAIHLVLDMDKMVGDQFEQGLTTLDTVTAAGAKPFAGAPTS